MKALQARIQAVQLRSKPFTNQISRKGKVMLAMFRLQLQARLQRRQEKKAIRF